MEATPFEQPISEQIWGQKYRFVTDRKEFISDAKVEDTWFRVANACTVNIHDDYERIQTRTRFYDALKDFKFLPAGRIVSGAGTERNVTLFNCFVMGKIPDSLAGIFDALKEAALTMQQGGGIGYDFSTLRPKGALVKKVEADASGPLTFMDVWDSMCRTIMSAGNRRGAMMATMRCDHPDIMDFIHSKRDPNRFRMFNLSVLITDDFMEAVKANADWDLVFAGKVYKTIKAKDLWDAIIENTYHYAEPGVIFIDRINKTNNLWFVEEICATNPCGEQPLPPYGACLLGSLNLAKFVINPFSRNKASIDFHGIYETVQTAVEMLDSVIDITNFPLEAQKIEAQQKRRMGIGITGLADMLFMIGSVYGSEEAVSMTNQVMYYVAYAAYKASVNLAKKLGCAPILESQENREKLINSGFMINMPQDLKMEILEHGLRNTHLISIAPTGTISLYANNVTSGIEPIFAPEYERKVTLKDGTKATEIVSVYSVHLFYQMGGVKGDDWWNDFMVTAQTLSPHDHIVMQAAAQKWTDSSISKTINCPEEIPFVDFKHVYEEAYEAGCKGCTTYRPNDVTGSVLSVPTEKPKEQLPALNEDQPTIHIHDGIIDRPDAVDGTTYKIRWKGDAIYVNLTSLPVNGVNMPFEIFITSKNLEHQAWTSGLTRMISAVFRRGGDVSFVPKELLEVYDPKGGQYIQGEYVPSILALIGKTIQEHMRRTGYQSTPEKDTPDPEEEVHQTSSFAVPDQCPVCKGFNMIKVSGCPTCQDCGHSKCG